MPNADATFSTDYLSIEERSEALFALPAALISLLGQHKLIAYYGWSCKIHGSLHYVPMEDRTDHIQYLIEDSVEQRIVTPGESDFYFEVPEEQLEILFCHECDIHVDGTNEDLMRRFMATEPYSRYKWHTKEEVQKRMGG